MHRSYCVKWGITPDELEGKGAKESEATTAYGAFIMDCGLQGASLLIFDLSCIMEADLLYAGCDVKKATLRN